MNVLNTNEIVTICILQEIKIKLLSEKARLQRNGCALEEEYIEDAPEELPALPPKQSDDENVIEGSTTTYTFDELLEEQLNEPSPIEELVQRAEHLELNGVSEDDILNAENAVPRKEIQGKQPTFFARFNAWLIARSAWRARKYQIDYEYERTKADVVNMCYGIDFAVKLIDAEIERQRSGRAVKVEIPKAPEAL